MIDDLGLNILDYGARLYDPLTGRWNGVDALAEKFASHSSYHYVLGNPIRYGDRDGRDTTVYVYFDPKNALTYFKEASNRKEFIDNLKFLFKKNGLTLNVVETQRTFSKIQTTLDRTDQYLDLSDSGTFEDSPIHSLTNGVTYKSHSRVNLSAREFGGKRDYYPLRLVLNTSVHEVFHGFIARAVLDYAPWQSQYYYGYNDSGNISFLSFFPFNFNDEGHYNGKQGNIMMDADVRSSHKNPTGFVGIPEIAPLLYNPFIKRSEINVGASAIQSTELLLPQHKTLLQRWFSSTLK